MMNNLSVDPLSPFYFVAFLFPHEYIRKLNKEYDQDYSNKAKVRANRWIKILRTLKNMKLSPAVAFLPEKISIWKQVFPQTGRISAFTGYIIANLISYRFKSKVRLFSRRTF